MLLQMLIEDPVRYIRIICIVLISITCHELAHGWAALSQGDDTPQKTGHMTLNPLVHLGWESILFLVIGGVAWGTMPVNPARFRSATWGKILVSLAGPLANLALGILFVLLLQVAIQFQGISQEFCYLAAQINFSLLLLNLIPIPPLDGFHILSGLLPKVKCIDGSPAGLFMMAFLILQPGFSTGLFTISNLMITLATEASTVVF